MKNRRLPLCLAALLIASSVLFTGCPKSGEDKEDTKSERKSQTETSIMGDGDDDEPETEKQPKSTTTNLTEHDKDAVKKIEGLLN